MHLLNDCAERPLWLSFPPWAASDGFTSFFRLHTAMTNSLRQHNNNNLQRQATSTALHGHNVLGLDRRMNAVIQEFCANRNPTDTITSSRCGIMSSPQKKFNIPLR
jgi:hypothetical protein